ncbi:hypothetical protein KI387_014078, partial [Taxus chinensis]
VQPECKGFPLSLRVIGISLRDEPPLVWKITKNKISRGEPISGYREGGDEMFNIPRISEINVDHCSDLEELPIEICSLNSLKMLSVTNCHWLAKLLDELGKLGALK